MKTQTIEEIEEMLSKHNQRDLEASKHGKRLAKSLLRKCGLNGEQKFDHFYASTAIANLLNIIRENDHDSECALMNQEWIFEKLAFIQISSYMEMFDDIHKQLIEKKFDCNNKLGYGDIDGSIWVEPHDEYKIVIIESHCAMRDDNTLIFIKQGSSLHARRVWPKQISQYGFLKKPSLRTYQKSKWKIRYRDGRDLGYCFTLDDLFKKVPSALYKAHEIYWSLWELNLIDSILKDTGATNET